MPLTRYKNSQRQLAAQIPPKEFYSCMTRAGKGRLGWRLLSKSRIWRKVVSQRQPDREVELAFTQGDHQRRVCDVILRQAYPSVNDCINLTPPDR
jgi:hypothetical protein